MSNLNLKRNLILAIDSLTFEETPANEPNRKKFFRIPLKEFAQICLNKLLIKSLGIYEKLPSRVKPMAKKIGKRVLRILGRM